MEGLGLSVSGLLLVMEVAEVCSKQGEAPDPTRHTVGMGGCPTFLTTHTRLLTLSTKFLLDN